MSIPLRNTGTMLALLLCAAFIRAQERQEYPSTSGNAYLRFCSATEKPVADETRQDVNNALMCIAYTEGVVQGAQLASALASSDKSHGSLFCIPAEGENGQYIRITMKYIRDNPAIAHQPTVALIIEALSAAFPCSPTPKNPKK